MPSWSDIFQYGTFLSVAFYESAWMSVSEHSSSPTFSMLLTISEFLSSSFCSYILLQNDFVSFASSIVVSCILHRFVGRIFFRYFGRPISFDLFLPVLLSNLSDVIFFGSFSFHCVLVNFSFLSTIACCCCFYTYLSSLFFHPDFVFLFGFLVGISVLSLTIFTAA